MLNAESVTMIKPNLSQRFKIRFLGRESKQASVVGGEHSSKELSEQRFYSYTEQLHMSARPAENARDIFIFNVASLLCGIRVRRGSEIEFEFQLGKPEEVLYRAEAMRTTRRYSTSSTYI
jgi:hypothetical protein